MVEEIIVEKTQGDLEKRKEVQAEITTEGIPEIALIESHLKIGMSQRDQSRRKKKRKKSLQLNHRRKLSLRKLSLFLCLNQNKSKSNQEIVIG